MASLEQVGEELVGQARCPFESGQTNVGLFAGESGGRSEPSRTSLTALTVLRQLKWELDVSQVEIFTRPP